MPRYRGRLAPSPTGDLHLGHARTFWTAQERARAQNGTLILRIEDLDHDRCRAEFSTGIIEDLSWFGFHWSEGPDSGGPHAPYVQSERDYLWAWQKLRAAGLIYPCTCSRRDVLSALGAPHERTGLGDEPLYPGTCRGSSGPNEPRDMNWRFRVPDRETLSFVDGRLAEQRAVAGRDFGDFLIWRKDNLPAYQLAVVADDALMEITEVVRGEDLLISTFRQLLLYRALELPAPSFFHCPLVTDETGRRMAKRHAAFSLRTFREKGISAEEIRAS